MKPCHEYAALLDLYVDGELSPQEMVQVQEHLDLCPGCQAYVDDALAIRAAFPEVEDTEVPEGFAESVCAVIQASDTAPKRNRRRRWAKTLLPMAACCAIVVLLSRLPLLDSAADTSQTADDPASMETAEPAPAAESDTAPIAQPKSGEAPAANAAPEVEKAPSDTPAPVQAFSIPAADSADSWAEYDNVVFVYTVFLTSEEAGGSLTDLEGKPYTNARSPELSGTGYAMSAAKAGAILTELGRSIPESNPEATTDRCCIVLTDQ